MASFVEKNVVVTIVEDIHEFYVLLQESKNKTQLQQKSQLCGNNESVAEGVKLNNSYLTKNENNEWNRIKILEDLSNDEFRVFFLDIGQFGIVDKTQIKTIDNKVSSLPARCSLDLKPMNMSDAQNAIEMNRVFKSLTCNSKCFRMLIKDIVNSIYVVDLITTDRMQNFSVTDFFLSINNFSFTPRVQIETKTIKTLNIPDGTSITVHHVESPFEFYVSRVDMMQEEEVMKLEMTSFYEQNPNNYTILIPGVKCATKDSFGKCHRVEILSSPDGDGWSKVRFIDTNKVDFLKWKELFELDEEFYNFPSFSIRCSMGGIRPIEDSWSIDAAEFLSCNLINSKIKLFGSIENAKLFVLENNTKINVNQALIFFGFAQPANESKEPEKVFEPIGGERQVLPSGKLLPAEIIDQEFDPFNFLVKYHEFDQRAVSLETNGISDMCDGIIWNVGDVCLVYCSVDKENKRWHRALITKLQSNFVCLSLLDYGITIKEMIDKLRKCPNGNKKLKFITISAKLACSISVTWSKGNQNLIQSIVNSYEKFYIDFLDDDLDENPRSVNLWGELSKGVKLNIARQLESIGDVEPALENVERMDFEELAESFEDSNEQENVFIKEYQVLKKKQFINNWLPKIINTKPNFFGVVTNIDRKGNIVLHSWKHGAILSEMSKLINELFQGSPPIEHSFKVGDPCIVRFEIDSFYYRGKVVGHQDDKYLVEFIDYGNIQKTDAKELFAEVVCSEIPPLAQKYRLEGSPVGTDGNINQKMLDLLHLVIVEHQVEVKVHDEDLNKNHPKFIKRCWITIDGRLIRSYEDFLASKHLFVVPDDNDA